MAEETIYRVRTVYDADTHGADTATESLARKHSVLASALSSTASGLSGLFDRVASTVMHAGIALGAVGLAGGIAAVVSGVTQLNAAAETTQIALAGMFQASGAVDTFNGAMSISEDIMRRMRVHARTLPGEFQDLVNVFQGGLMSGLSAGKTSAQIEDLSAQFMAVSQTMHVDSQTAGRELAMMLEGRAGSHIVMWSRIRTLVGKTSEEFNHMTSAARFEAIQRALSGFRDAVGQYGTSWDAVTSTAKDHLHDLLRIGTAPLFDRVKATLQHWNELFEANEDRIMAMARMVGGRLADAFDKVVHGAERLVEIVRHLNMHDVMGQLGNALTGGSLLRAGLGMAAGGGMGLAGAAIALPIAAAVASGNVNVGRTLRDLEESSRPLMRALRDLWTALQPIVVTLGTVLAQALTGLVLQLTDVATKIVGFATTLTNVVGWVMSHIPGMGGGPVAPEGMGTTEAEARGLRPDSSSFFGGIASNMRSAFAYQRAQERGDQTAMDILTVGARYSTDQLSDAMAQHTRVLAHAINTGALEHRPTNAAQQAPRGHMNVNVRIQQTINDASDPGRVLVETKRALLQSLRHPIESANAVILR